MVRRSLGWLTLIGAVVVLTKSPTFYIPKLDDSKKVLAATTSKELTVEQRVAALERRVANLEYKNIAVKAQSSAKETYVNLTGGSVTTFDWAMVPGTQFWLDSSLYGGSVEVSWQGRMGRSEGSEFRGAIRLYDLTNHRVVDNSTLEVAGSGLASFYSKTLSIWRGQNQYQIEVRNSTGEELRVESARLKILVK